MASTSTTIPCNWDVRPLESLLSRPLAYGVLKPGDNDPHGVPLVRIQDVHTGVLDPVGMLKISASLHKEFKRTELKAGDLLFSVVGTIGKVVEVTASLSGGNVSRALCVIGANDEVDRSFLKQFLQSDQVQQWADREARGNAQRVLNLGVLRGLPVPIPRIPEQKKIAAILASVDDAIQATQAIISQTRKVRQGLLQQLLARGIGHTRFKQTEIGEIPENWDVQTIEGLAAKERNAIVDGPFGSNLKSEHYRSTGIPVIQSGFVTSNRFHAETYVYVDQELFEQQKRSQVSEGDIVMAKIGARCGTSAILPAGHPTSILAGNCLKITPDPALCLTQYLLMLLHNYHATGILSNVISTTAQPAINMKGLKSLRVPVPPLAEQAIIVNIVESVYELIALEDQKLKQLRQMKAGLMADLLSGRKRIEVSA